MTAILTLLLLQGALGAFDTLYHHELSESLPRRATACLELRLHAVRALFYGVLFAALAWSRWQGAWALLLAAIVVLEVVLTLWDFVEEDRSRALPASERVLHTVLAINGGALFALLAAERWWEQPTALVLVNHGWASLALSLMAAGVVLSGLRDAMASVRLRQSTALDPALDVGPPRRWLITGGSGFIGRQLVNALTAAGHPVTVLSRRPRELAVRYGGRVRVVGDLQLLGAADRFDVIVNLAGAPIMAWPWTQARRQRLQASRIDLTRRLVHWLRLHPHPGAVLISASAVGIYGSEPLYPCDEHSAVGTDFAARLCQEWEREAQAARDAGLRVVILRLGLVLHAAGGVWPLLSLPVRLGAGGRTGSGRQPFPWVHLLDVLRAIASAATDEHWSGVFNMVAPQRLSQGEFMAHVARRCRRPLFMHLPAPLLRLLLGERAKLLLHGQDVRAERLQQQGFVFVYGDCRTALAELLPGS